MPRQLKNYMRSKKTMWNCQEPVCATLNAWKCMNEFCGCGLSLLSYDELLALDNYEEIVKALNSNPAAYYAALKKEGYIHIEEDDAGDIGVIIDDNQHEVVIGWHLFIYVIRSSAPDVLPQGVWIAQETER